MNLLQLFLDVLFPKRCVGCKSIGSYICLKCIPTILQKNLVCVYCHNESFGGITHPLLCQQRSNLDGAWFLGTYEGVLKKAILKLKYHFVSSLAQELAELLIAYIDLRDPYFLEQIKDHPDKWIMTAVPLSKYRENMRGFNQSELLAKILAQKLNLKYVDLLKRTRETKPQVGLKANLRRENVKNAFTIENYKFKIENSTNILLVDDVWTTGSTLKECAKKLKMAGVEKVWALTIAH